MRHEVGKILNSCRKIVTRVISHNSNFIVNRQAFVYCPWMTQKQRIEDGLVFIDAEKARQQEAAEDSRALMNNKSDPVLMHNVAKGLAGEREMERLREEVTAIEPVKSEELDSKT